MYSTVRPNRQDVQRAEVKAKLLTGTYTLQSNRAAFNQHAVDPLCRMCSEGPETREHFIASCTSTQQYKTKYKEKIGNILKQYPDVDPDATLANPRLFTHVVLDCTHPDVYTTRLRDEDISSLESLSREYIMRIHLARCRQLANQAIDTG